jgi:LPXTG-motif cell wall-anchored protein
MKISRIAFSALAAGALVLGPTAVAFADTPVTYEAPGVTATVSDVTPAPGATFTFVIDVPAGVTQVTLTVSAPGVSSSNIAIAGSKSLTKAAADGSATFDVTLNAAGTFTLVATDPATGAVLASQAITVAAPTTGGTGNLASTGSNETPLIAGAAALVVLGAGGVVLARRRRAHQG